MSIPEIKIGDEARAELETILTSTANTIAAEQNAVAPQLSEPFRSFVIHTPRELGRSTSKPARGAGWLSLLYDGEEPCAVLEARWRRRRVRFSASTTGEWPRNINRAILWAEENQLLHENDQVAFLTVPCIGLTLLWIGGPDVMVPVVSRHGVERLRAYPTEEMRKAVSAAVTRVRAATGRGSTT